MNTLDLLKKNIDFNETIIGREKYFNSAVLVSLIEIDGILNFVFQKRSSHIRQGGEISFPGGGYEKDDINFLDTALRETEEEIGIHRNNIEVLGKIGTHIVPNGVIVEAYLGIININSLDDFKINEEVEKLIYIPVEYFINTSPRIEKVGVTSHPNYIEDGIEKFFPAEELNLPKKYRKSWSGKPREVSLFFYEGEIIWGITANIIIEVTKHIKNLGETL